MICLQGTSFSFISVILSAGFMVKARGGGTDEILSTIFGICFFAAFIEVVLSQFIGKLRKLITPVVTGTIITLMGLSLMVITLPIVYPLVLGLGYDPIWFGVIMVIVLLVRPAGLFGKA